MIIEQLQGVYRPTEKKILAFRVLRNPPPLPVHFSWMANGHSYNLVF